MSEEHICKHCGAKKYPDYIERVDRIEDMSPVGRLELIRQEDGDIIISIYPQSRQNPECVDVGGSLEFCTSMGGSHSLNTFWALGFLMEAMEKDNKESPLGRVQREPAGGE